MRYMSGDTADLDRERSDGKSKISLKISHANLVSSGKLGRSDFLGGMCSTVRLFESTR